MRYSDHEQLQLDIASGQELDRRASKRSLAVPSTMLTAVVAYHWKHTDVDVVIKFKPALTGGWDVIEVYVIHPLMGSHDVAPREIWAAVGEHLREGGEIKDAMDLAHSEQMQIAGRFL